MWELVYLSPVLELGPVSASPFFLSVKGERPFLLHFRKGLSFLFPVFSFFIAVGAGVGLFPPFSLLSNGPWLFTLLTVFFFFVFSTLAYLMPRSTFSPEPCTDVPLGRVSTFSLVPAFTFPPPHSPEREGISPLFSSRFFAEGVNLERVSLLHLI